MDELQGHTVFFLIIIPIWQKQNKNIHFFSLFRSWNLYNPGERQVAIVLVFWSVTTPFIETDHHLDPHTHLQSDHSVMLMNQYCQTIIL